MRSTVLVSLTTLSIGASSLFLPATAAAEELAGPEIDPTAVMGPAQEYQRGLTVNGVAPTLRSVVVDGESILAYCIEYWIRAADPDHEAAVTGWDEFTGDNHFKTDPQVREQVAWILRHSYPTLSVAEVAERVDIADLSTAEVITATQAAIWHFTDDFVPDGKLAIEAGPNQPMDKDSAAHVQAVFDYLTGAANTGLTEQESQASVTLENGTEEEAELPEIIAESMTNDDDHVFGPILLNASGSEVELSVQHNESDISLDDFVVLDQTGESVDLEQPVDAQELWVHVPAETESGSLELAAESVEYGYTGRLIIPEPDGQRRFQTIVVVDQTTNHAATEIALAWEQPVKEEPELTVEPSAPDPTPEPEETPPVQEPVAEEPPVQEPVAEEPPVQEPPMEAPAANYTPPPEQPETPAPLPPVESPAIDNAALEKSTDAEPALELAVTGAHQTRNVLVALGTMAVGAGLLVVSRLRKRRT